MKLCKKYEKFKAKQYKDLKQFFFQDKEIVFSKNDGLEKIKEQFIFKEINVSRVWLLFASNDNNNWECLQVGQSKNKVKKEIEDVIDFLFCDYNQKLENIAFTHSVFYENQCPKTTKENYRKLLYSKIGSEYTYFRICFLNVDKYIGTKSDNNINKTDTERIIQICKNQYAEAKIAYQTLAVYWRNYSSGIDGQTIDYILKHTSEFK